MNPLPIEALERQIEDTRRSLDRILSALQFKLSPREQAALALRRATATPVPAVALALGLAVVLYLGVRGHRARQR